MEAVKQGSCAVGLRSNTHVVLCTLKRASSELSSHQKKLFHIDDHVGIAERGLELGDARVAGSQQDRSGGQQAFEMRRCVTVDLFCGVGEEYADVDTDLTQDAGHREAVAAVVALAADDDHRKTVQSIPAGLARLAAGCRGALHQRRTRDSGGCDGATVNGGHLGAGYQLYRGSHRNPHLNPAAAHVS